MTEDFASARSGDTEVFCFPEVGKYIWVLAGVTSSRGPRSAVYDPANLEAGQHDHHWVKNEQRTLEVATIQDSRESGPRQISGNYAVEHWIRA
jgi:hypothetical protein